MKFVAMLNDEDLDKAYEFIKELSKAHEEASTLESAQSRHEHEI